MNVAPYSYLDLREAISIEKRYTIEDLTFSWQMGYDARIQEERENERMRSSGDNDEGYDSKLRGTNETSKIFGRDEYRSCEKLNTEIKRLERILDTEPRRLYQIQKKFIGARDSMRDVMRKIEELLRSE